MNWLNYHHLYYFHRIVEAGSVSAAAESLRIGQPALSGQLKELEARLGILFERKSRRLVMNERGKIVYKYTREIFSRGDELLHVLERGELAPQRELILGTQEGVPKAIIAEIVGRLFRKTGARIRVSEGDAPSILEELLAGRADLVLLDHELTHSAGTVYYFDVGEERVSFWGTQVFRKKGKKFPANLDGTPMVISGAGHPLRNALENFFSSNDIQLNTVAEVPDTGVVKELVRSGLGVAALGDKTARAWAKAGAIVKLGNLPYTQKYLLGVQKRFLKDPVAEILKKEFGAVRD